MLPFKILLLSCSKTEACLWLCKIAGVILIAQYGFTKTFVFMIYKVNKLYKWKLLKEKLTFYKGKEEKNLFLAVIGLVTSHRLLNDQKKVKAKDNEDKKLQTFITIHWTLAKDLQSPFDVEIKQSNGCGSLWVSMLNQSEEPKNKEVRGTPWYSCKICNHPWIFGNTLTTTLYLSFFFLNGFSKVAWTVNGTKTWNYISNGVCKCPIYFS